MPATDPRATRGGIKRATPGFQKLVDPVGGRSPRNRGKHGAIPPPHNAAQLGGAGSSSLLPPLHNGRAGSGRVGRMARSGDPRNRSGRSRPTSRQPPGNGKPGKLGPQKPPAKAPAQKTPGGDAGEADTGAAGDEGDEAKAARQKGLAASSLRALFGGGIITSPKSLDKLLEIKYAAKFLSVIRKDSNLMAQKQEMFEIVIDLRGTLDAWHKQYHSTQQHQILRANNTNSSVCKGHSSTCKHAANVTARARGAAWFAFLLSLGSPHVRCAVPRGPEPNEIGRH